MQIGNSLRAGSLFIIIVVFTQSRIVAIQTCCSTAGNDIDYWLTEVRGCGTETADLLV